MPLLENLILGKLGGERRRRFVEDRSLTGAPGVDDDPYATAKGPANGMGGMLGKVWPLRGIHAVRPREGAKSRACGNPSCETLWLPPWKSREHPVFNGHWVCGSRCLEAMARTALLQETGDASDGDGGLHHRHRIPLGLVMLGQGVITHPQLKRALDAQRSNGGGRIGHWLVSECNVPPQRVAQAVGVQWNCPVLSTEGFWPEAMALVLPREFLKDYGVVPLRIAGRKILYVGFQDCMDAATTFALERMTGLRVESGVLPEAEFEKAKETMLRCDFPRQTVAPVGDRDGLVRAIAATLEHGQPAASRLVKLHRYFWLRTWAKTLGNRTAGEVPASVDAVTDYLFLLGSGAPSSARQDWMNSPIAETVAPKTVTVRDERSEFEVPSLQPHETVPSAAADVIVGGAIPDQDVLKESQEPQSIEKAETATELRHLARWEEATGKDENQLILRADLMEESCCSTININLRASDGTHRQIRALPIELQYSAISKGSEAKEISLTAGDTRSLTEHETETRRSGWTLLDLWRLKQFGRNRESVLASGQAQEE